MPLTGLVAEARKRTALIEGKVEEVRQNPSQLKQEAKRVMDFSAEVEQAAKETKPHWTACKHLKQAGERNFCKRYIALCAEEKCGDKFVNGDENEIDFRRIMSGNRKILR